jgi:hypothetical protein
LRAPDADAAPETWFGWSVAMDGTRVVVGANNVIGGNPGTAFVYELASLNPTVPVAILKQPNPTGNTLFGSAVAISGDWVVVAAPREEGQTGLGGRVYVYDLAGTTPQLPRFVLENPTQKAWDEFGHAIAMSGSRLAVSAPGDTRGAPNVGIVYLYDLAGNQPANPIAIFDNPEAEASDRFGTSLALSSDRLVVGTPYDNAGAFKAGCVFVYALANPARVPQFTFYNPTPVEHDNFGASVAISGDRLVIADAREDVPLASRGTVRVYDLASATPLMPIAQPVDPDTLSQSGFAIPVALHGNHVVVSAMQHNSQIGTAHLFDLSSSTPSQAVHTYRSPEPSGSSFFGGSLALRDEILAVGIPRNDKTFVNQGAVAIYAPAATAPAHR